MKHSIDCVGFNPLRTGEIPAFPADRVTLLAATFDGGDVGGPA